MVARLCECVRERKRVCLCVCVRVCEREREDGCVRLVMLFNETFLKHLH